MLQCFLTGQNGLLSLRKPQRVPDNSYSPADYGWALTDLDNILVEELVEELALLHNQGPRSMTQMRHTSWRATCPPVTQYQLWSNNGLVALKHPKDQPHHPLKHLDCVKSDPRDHPTTRCFKPRSSILRLPPELRLPIYRHLLVRKNVPIHHPICPSTDGFRIVVGKGRDVTHKLYPEILATCRLINQEGTPMLYEENMFRRKFFWPRKRHAVHGQLPLPLLGSYPLSSQNIKSISRIWVFRQYRQWLLGDGELKIFQDFPSLKELQIDVCLSDSDHGVSAKVLWQEAMRSVSRKQPKLKCVRSRIQPVYDRDYYAWAQSEQLDFSFHKKKSKEVEKWMEDEKLFAGRNVAWSFQTVTSEYCGPCCSLELEISDMHNAD